MPRKLLFRCDQTSAVVQAQSFEESAFLMLIITASNCSSIFALRLFLLMDLHVPEDSLLTNCSKGFASTNDSGKPHFTTKLTMVFEAASWVTFF